jgi:hypothetical protein
MRKLVLPTYAALVTVLLLLDVFLRGSPKRPGTKPTGTASERILLIPVRTNGMHGTALMDTAKNQMIRVEWFLNREDKPDAISYCFEGKDLFELHLGTNGPPGRAVNYYDADGNKALTLLDHLGLGQFTERITYPAGEEKLEIWVENAWRKFESRGGVRGVMLERQWCALSLTNGVWSIRRAEGPVNNK